MPILSPFIESAQRTLKLESEAILAQIAHLDESYVSACKLMLNCRGRIVLTGMGKSGHIANKFAATLASTGTPAFCMHPGEASHGDLGMVTAGDIVVALSNSGNSQEIAALIPLLRRINVPLIAMTGNTNSTLAKAAHTHLLIKAPQEACPLGLAPTSSTTAAIAMGDAIAISLMEARGFTVEDFAFSHPGGSLGKRLLIRVQDIMRHGAEVPIVTPNTTLTQSLLEISSKGLGMTCIVDDKQHITGVFTDGDLCRALDKKIDLNQTTIKDVMTTDFTTIRAEALAITALELMQNKRITALPVVTQDGELTGAINMHDLLKAGVE